MHKRFRHLSGALVVCLSVVLTLLAGGVFSPRTAHAATQVSVFHMRGQTAQAFFDSTDATGCIDTSVIVGGGESLVLSFTTPQGGAPQQQPNMFVGISQFDNCTGFLLVNVFATSPVFDFHLAADLSSATLTSSLSTINEVTGDPLNLDVSVTWAGTGTTTRQATPSHFSAPGLRVNGIVVGFTRAATATGTITDGTTNFTPMPSTPSTMFPTQVMKVTSGEITITQG